MRFWHDSGIGGIPLKIQFSCIYEFCQKPDAMVRDMWDGDEWDIPALAETNKRTDSIWKSDNRMERAKGDVKLDDLGKHEVKRAIDKSQVLSTNHYISA